MSKQTSFDPSTFTWPCDICGQERPDARISTHRVELGPATTRSVKFCNDNPHCLDGALNWNEEEYQRKKKVP